MTMSKADRQHAKIVPFGDLSASLIEHDRQFREVPNIDYATHELRILHQEHRRLVAKERRALQAWLCLNVSDARFKELSAVWLAATEKHEKFHDQWGGLGDGHWRG